MGGSAAVAAAAVAERPVLAGGATAEPLDRGVVHSFPSLTGEPLDVLVVGAGLSGVAAGYHLQDKCPEKRYAIVEMREAMGGTWDLFRYPGVRSDSDMHTLGYAFRPWDESVTLADGPAIRDYIRNTAAEYGIDRHVHYGHRVEAARWSSEDALWTVSVRNIAEDLVLPVRCRFLFLCSGYYDYARGYTPAFEGVESFGGRVVHPQFWPEDLDYAGKKVVVIGSGATAVTLVPAMAETAAHVTMLQRSPTYVLSIPGEDAMAAWLREHLPTRAAHAAIRWKNVLFSMGFYHWCRLRPEQARRWLLKQVDTELGGSLPLEPHFAPRYAPWDQRLCFVPDADLFAAIQAGTASVVTDQVDRFTASGVRLQSGEELEADIVVTATGLELKLLAGLQFEVDGQLLNASDLTLYKGSMLSDVPNLAVAIGYTNASWTLKCDLTCEYVCRLIQHMDREGYDACTPRTPAGLEEESALPLQSGYILRMRDRLPKQGTAAPWKLYQNYALDRLWLKYLPVADDALEWTRAGAGSSSRLRP